MPKFYRITRTVDNIEKETIWFWNSEVKKESVTESRPYSRLIEGFAKDEGYPNDYVITEVTYEVVQEKIVYTDGADVAE